VKEESQIEDMRAALRGDRERAEQARERSSENVRALIETPAEDVASELELQRSRGFMGRLLGR